MTASDVFLEGCGSHFSLGALRALLLSLSALLLPFRALLLPVGALRRLLKEALQLRQTPLLSHYTLSA